MAASRRILPEAAIPGLNAFVLYFALPCMLFRFGMRTPVRELFDPVLIGVYLLCALLIVAFTIRVTLTKHVHLKDASFGALVAAFPNPGFMGVPLLVALLGQAAALPSASNVSLLAERYGADNGRIARIILTSTALAFVTFTLLAWTLGV